MGGGKVLAAAFTSPQLAVAPAPQAQGTTLVTRVISYTYDPLNRLIAAEYSTGEAYAYQHDAVGNRIIITSTTPLSGTVVTTHTYDAANRLTARAVSDGRAYTYDWSPRGQLLTEWTQGYPVREFTYDGAGRMIRARVFTQTTEFVYNGLGDRIVVNVDGYGATTYVLDYAANSRILAETTPTRTVQYLYGHDCLGEFRDDVPLYYLPNAEGYVRQGVDADGDLVSAWLFDPDGTVLEGPNGPVSHLVCGGVYDWSTGLLYRGGRYFDPALGIWLALLPLAVAQAWPGQKRRKGGHPWIVLLCVGVYVMGMLAGCCSTDSLPISPEPKCSDFDLTMDIVDSNPHLYQDPFKPTGWAYGKEVRITITPKPTSVPYPLGEELSDKCSIVQWVEGCRKVDGQFVPDPNYPGKYWNHPEIYKPDADVTEDFFPRYELYQLWDATMETVTGLEFSDTPAQGLGPGQLLEVDEHYITALYSKEDVDQGWGSVPMSRAAVLATPIIQSHEWDFVAVYRRP